MNPLAWLLATITGSIAFWSLITCDSWLDAVAWAVVLLLAIATGHEEIRISRRLHQRHSSSGGDAARMP
jgi:hypothetical protein